MIPRNLIILIEHHVCQALAQGQSEYSEDSED